MVTLVCPFSGKLSQMLEPPVPAATVGGPPLLAAVNPNGVPDNRPLPVGKGIASLERCLGGGVGAFDEVPLAISVFFGFWSTSISVR
jgi:hypothetical protein